MNTVAARGKPFLSVSTCAGGRMKVELALSVGLVAVLSCDNHRPKEAGESPVPSTPSPVAVNGLAQAKGTVTGSVNGKPFRGVEAAWRIESPDVEGVNVVYLFSSPVRCIDLSFTGWDRGFDNGTTVLALEMFGTTSGDYLVGPGPAPSSHGAIVQWIGPSSHAAPSSITATGGWVVLDASVPRSSTSGSFDVSFGANRLTGTFNASFCAGGHEP
jgi:hypothetical protein